MVLSAKTGVYLLVLTFTVRRFLPLALLLLSTFVPPGELILVKNPWVFFLFLLFGWNVLLLIFPFSGFMDYYSLIGITT